MSDFIIIAEKIHCSRVLPATHPRLRGNSYWFDDTHALPVDPSQKIRPFAVAAQLLLHGSTAEQQAAEAFVALTAREQTAAGASYLDINVDEFSTDVDEKKCAMQRIAQIALAASDLPLSIDASHPDVLLAGLVACHASRHATLMNSLALDRMEALEYAVRFNANLILLSTPADGAIPASAEARCEIQQTLFEKVRAANIAPSRCFLDPLVMPVATDPTAPATTLATIRLFRETFGPAVRITGGINNVSFGMPARTVINNVFAGMCFAAGADSGILDPLLIAKSQILSPDTTTDDYRYAHAVLAGEDEYGMDYLDAYREGRLSISER